MSIPRNPTSLLKGHFLCFLNLQASQPHSQDKEQGWALRGQGGLLGPTGALRPLGPGFSTRTCGPTTRPPAEVASMAAGQLPQAWFETPADAEF